MKISVIIPCYNCAEFIERAVLSVISQTISDYEIILVDNNSTDETLDKLLSLQRQFPDKIKVLNEFAKGAPAARNNGLAEAKGEFIQFLDADDELLPLKMELQYEMAQLTKADVVIGNHVLIYTVDSKIKRHIKHADPNPWEGLIASNLGITSSILWKRDTLQEIGGWDVALTSSQEYNLIFSLLKAGANFAYHAPVLTNIYKSDSSISKSTNKNRLEEIIKNRVNLRIAIKEYLRQMDITSPKLNRLIDTYIYSELMTWLDILPEFAGTYLRNNQLDVAKSRILKTRVKRLFKGRTAL